MQNLWNNQELFIVVLITIIGMDDFYNLFQLLKKFTFWVYCCQFYKLLSISESYTWKTFTLFRQDEILVSVVKHHVLFPFITGAPK